MENSLAERRFQFTRPSQAGWRRTDLRSPAQGPEAGLPALTFSRRDLPGAATPTTWYRLYGRLSLTVGISRHPED